MKTSVLKKGEYTVRVKGPKKISSLDELFKVISENWISGKDFLKSSRKNKAEQYPAQNLSYYRKKSKMTQAELAKAVNSKFRHHISEMETGKRPIGKVMARKLAKALGIEALWKSLLTDL